MVVLDAGGRGRCSVLVTHGALALHRGGHGEPTLTVRGSLETLLGVVEGRCSGMEEFLEGRITIRGDLALSLALDGLFVRDAQPHHWPRTDVIDAGGVRTAYLEAGPPHGVPVLLLHGLGATFASMLPLISDLAKTHRVIAPDLPGFGESAKPRGRYDAPWFARWGLNFLDALQVQSASVVGNSLGGRVALELGMSAPDRVDGLALLCPSPAFRRMRQFSPLVRLLRPELAALGVPISHRLVVEGIRAFFSVPDRLPQEWYDAAADEFQRVFASRKARLALFAALRQIYLEQAHGDLGFWDRLPALAPPALFVWGDRDRLVPAGFSRHVQAALPAARSVVLADCGHVPQFEHREQTSALVLELLGHVRG